MDADRPSNRRDLLRVAAVALVGVGAWLPLELVRREVLPWWVFLVYAGVALALAVVMLPSAVRSIARNRPGETGERYWTLD